MTRSQREDVQQDRAGHRKRSVVAVVVLVAVLVLAVAARLSPAWPGPGLPPGATRVHIATEEPHLLPAFGCPLALLAPVRVATSGDDLVVVSMLSGEVVPIVWPSGWVAWRVDGRAELVARDGSVVAREGDVIEDRYGGGTGLDDAFHVCIEGN